MVTKQKLKDYANKLMFDMNEDEYETLLSEFDVIEKQMELVANLEGIEKVNPMTFPFEMDYVSLRDDENIRTIDYMDALSNAKDIKGREIKVPKVVE